MGVVVEAPIPRHITGIYVFAVVNLLVMLCISTVDAEIIVRDTSSNETAAEYPDTQAKFGPDFPTEGLEGRLVYAEPDPQACSAVKPPPPSNDTYPWILLIARGGNCQFSDKVLNAQLNNYSAAIVHNFPHKDGSTSMGGGKNGSKITIPSTFVGWQSGMDLRMLYDYKHKEYIIRIWEDDSIDYSSYLWPFLLVMAICILMVMIFLLLKFLRDHATRRLSRLSNKHLKKIPVRKFKKGDYYDTCAICLDEYEEGEKIRVLPCDHVYHRKCIDPWLTKNKKTCPVCKRRVIPGRDADSESGSEAEDAGVSNGGSENTPLLGGRSAQPPRQQYSSSVSGPMATPALQDNGAVVPADSVSEDGAVGGVGTSQRSLQKQTPLTRAVSSQGNIQDSDERTEVRSERKQKRRARDWRRKRAEEAENAGLEDVGAAGTSQLLNTTVHRERTRKKKDKKRVRNAHEVNSAGDDKQKMENNPEGDSHQKDDSEETASGGTRTTAVLVRIDEGSDDESYMNPGFSGYPTVTNPAVARRREINEVV
ncbi:hypothetical protein BsWGS_03717 [Bradybaena similaris]